MIGLGALNRSINNIAKAAELQTQVLVVNSAKSVADAVADTKLTAKDLKALQELSNTLSNI
ncbi:hypothetical protein VPHD128_0093 [Vibrio phage D128]